MRSRYATFTCVSIALALGTSNAHRPRALDNGLARTPPMDWNSWNHFGCDVSAKLISATVPAHGVVMVRITRQ